MRMRIIESGAAEERIRDLFLHDNRAELWQILNAIQHTPTILICPPWGDIVHVVRCKDCRYSQPIQRDDGTMCESILDCHQRRGYDQELYGKSYSVIHMNHFCSAGKPKEAKK